jgi:hypothetical protein
VIGSAAVAGASLALDSGARRLVEAAAATCPGRASLSDIEHVVILIRENRSFDHYFGTLPGVGFDDHDARDLAPFAQRYPANTTRAPVGRLLAFRFDVGSSNGECTNGIDHEWTTQHRSWNGGRMDQFVTTHEAVDGAGYGTATMGYYTRADLPLHYALADAFTVCDRWRSSSSTSRHSSATSERSGWRDRSAYSSGPQRLFFASEISLITSLTGASRSVSLGARDARHAYAVMRGLTTPGGGMVAAATMGLPERASTGRSYDYSYVWIRDQCYAGQAVAKAGTNSTCRPIPAARRSSATRVNTQFQLVRRGAAPVRGRLGPRHA